MAVMKSAGRQLLEEDDDEEELLLKSQWEEEEESRASHSAVVPATTTTRTRVSGHRTNAVKVGFGTRTTTGGVQEQEQPSPSTTTAAVAAAAGRSSSFTKREEQRLQEPSSSSFAALIASNKPNKPNTSNNNSPSTNNQSKYTHQELGSIYPFSYSLVSAARSSAVGSRYYPYSYDPGISPSIDISSSSSSIFYTVPLSHSKRKTNSEALGTPSILKPSFRQLQEPTRLSAVRSRRPNIYVPPVSVSRSRKSTISSRGSAESESAATTVQQEQSNSQSTSVRSESRLTGISETSELQVQKQGLAIESPSMPLRVRMRRDEYYYTETSTKATQTEEMTELKEKRRQSSSKAGTSSGGRRSSKAQTTDRATSPISQMSSAQYLKKLEDLEKITGHFVIQRFFTRTDQDFTLWLEQQLASKSEAAAAAAAAAREKSPECIKDTSETETDTVPLLPQIAADLSQIQRRTAGGGGGGDDERSEGTLIETPIISRRESIVTALPPSGRRESNASIASSVEVTASSRRESMATDILPSISRRESTVSEILRPPSSRRGSRVVISEVEEAVVSTPRITDITRPAVIDEIDDIIIEAATRVEAESETESAAKVTPPPAPISVKTIEVTSSVATTESTTSTTTNSEVKELSPSPTLQSTAIISETKAAVETLPKASEETKIQEVVAKVLESPVVSETKPALETLPSSSEEAKMQEVVARLESQLVDATPKVEKKCTLSDPIPCECFAKHFLQEENIAKLLIALSPRTSTPLVEIPDTAPIKIGEDAHALDSFEKFQAHLQAKPANSIQVSASSDNKPEDKIMKHSDSFAYGTTTGSFFTVEATVLSVEGRCQDFPSFVFPHPQVNRMKKSQSIDSCLGTDMSSIKTSHDSGSTSGRILDGTINEKIMDNLNISQDSHSVHTLEDMKASIEEEVISNKDSGFGGGSSSVRSSWYETPEMPRTSRVEKRSAKSEQAGKQTRKSGDKEEKSDNNNKNNDMFSADSDSESEIVISENYHARSEAESDTEMTTDGDAVADDNLLGFTKQNDNNPLDEIPNDDNTDVDEDDKDNDLLARMELDELRLEIDKPGSTIRTTCTQTNRSLFSSAWSNGSSASSSTTTNGSGSYIDLEVVSRKYPNGPSTDARRNYLPSSSSSLNYANCNMNFSVKTDESKFKMSLTLPGLKPSPNSSGRAIVGGGGGGGGGIGRPIHTRKLPLVPKSEEYDQDLPSLWAHVRNRLDSKVSLDIPPATDLAVRGDRIPGASTNKAVKEAHHSHARDRASKYQRPHHHQPQQQHQGQPHFLQQKHPSNDDRIKRSLERLSKLLDIDK